MISEARYEHRHNFDALPISLQTIDQASVLLRVGGSHPRVTLLLRLPPPSVAMTTEVRCAVVGNVDSGKSTTLGVLTRGSFSGQHSSALFERY